MKGARFRLPCNQRLLKLKKNIDIPIKFHPTIFLFRELIEFACTLFDFMPQYSKLIMYEDLGEYQACMVGICTTSFNWVSNVTPGNLNPFSNLNIRCFHALLKNVRIADLQIISG